MLIFFHIPDIFYSIERLYKIIPTLVLLSQTLNQLFEAGKDWIPPTYLEKENNSSKNNSINNLTEGFCSLHDKLIILLNSLSH